MSCKVDPDCNLRPVCARVAIHMNRVCLQGGNNARAPRRPPRFSRSAHPRSSRTPAPSPEHRPHSRHRGTRCRYFGRYCCRYFGAFRRQQQQRGLRWARHLRCPAGVDRCAGATTPPAVAHRTAQRAPRQCWLVTPVCSSDRQSRGKRGAHPTPSILAAQWPSRN